MKLFAFFLFAILSCLSIKSYSQTAKHYLYLIVSIQNDYDEDGKAYYKIEPEQGNSNAEIMGALVKYKSELKAKNIATFYSLDSDTTKPLFNYFGSVSTVLQFLDAHGWQLFSVFNDTRSFSNTVETKPVYYLRREVEPR